MQTTKRQTSANNATLAHVKSVMNAAIYKAVMDAWNTGGRDAAKAEFSRHFNTSPAAVEFIGEVFGDDTSPV